MYNKVYLSLPKDRSDVTVSILFVKSIKMDSTDWLRKSNILGGTRGGVMLGRSSRTNEEAARLEAHLFQASRVTGAASLSLKEPVL